MDMRLPAVLRARSAWEAGKFRPAAATSNKAKLVTFPEAFVPGYPAWIWTRPVDPVLSTQYIKNSLVVSSPEMRTIQSCAASHGIVVSLGFSENDHNSLYIAQAIIDSDGKLLMKRRKIKATHMERTIFGDASGSSLLNVVDTGLGRRVGALACWEHAQPLLKYNTLQQREDIHCAAWPPIVTHQGGPDLWSLSLEGCRTLSQAYAIESQAFVLHSTTIIGQKGIDRMSTSAGLLMSTPGGGASTVFGPDGRQLTELLGPEEEGIVYADLQMDQAIFARSFLDVCGHYSRPDLMWLGVDTREREVRVEKVAPEAE
ncbi:Arylacetonitrilase [Lachnellula suecica]|uniref:nitrilase n=1 Tax=Lachnellula suecica TaxID=602035 RepID=A0A8T9BZG4_9HELO|nr:Arylacetonitrilase [Lachnellula suecica]